MSCNCNWPDSPVGTPHTEGCEIWKDPTPAPADRYMQSLFQAAERAAAVCVFMAWLASFVTFPRGVVLNDKRDIDLFFDAVHNQLSSDLY